MLYFGTLGTLKRMNFSEKIVKMLGLIKCAYVIYEWPLRTKWNDAQIDWNGTDPLL